MERILAMKQGAYGLFKGVIDPGKTKALDAHTVQFTLNQPYAVFSAHSVRALGGQQQVAAAA